MSKTPPNTVQSTGARAGDVLVGAFDRNEGLLIKINADQTDDYEWGGRIQGGFTILDAGTGTYAQGIKTVCAKKSEYESVEEFLKDVSGQPGCEDITHALNKNALWRLNSELIRDKILV